MKLAIDTFSYHMHFGKHRYKPPVPVGLEWYLNKSKNLSMDGIHLDPCHYDVENDMERITGFSHENGMYVELGAMGITREDLFPYIDAASRYGIGVIRTFVGGTCLDGRTETGNRARVAGEKLKKAADYGEERNVKIAIENHGDLFLEDLMYLMDLSDNLGICYDSGNFAITGENPLEAVGLLGERILMTHIKDVCDDWKYPGAEAFKTMGAPVHFCPLGEGFLPIREILHGILSLKPDINITLEICSPILKNINGESLLLFEENNVLKSIDFIKGCF